MPAGKFLSIVDKVRRKLALDENIQARIFGRVAGGPDQLHDIESIRAVDGAIEVRLEPVSATCKAGDRRESMETGNEVGCCGSRDKSESSVGCGCEIRKSAPAASETAGTRGAENSWFTPFESQGFRMMF
jgi:hypothetical protein